MIAFKQLINSLTPIFKSMGFSKKNNSFYLEKDRNYGIVNFQKSKESSKDVVKFRINFGVYSDALGQLEYEYISSAIPSVEQCHWLKRVGSFVPDKPDDDWWVINELDNIDSIAQDMIIFIQSIVVPEINKRLSDNGLIDSWINDNYAGTSEIGRFIFLTTLLKTRGELNTLDQIVEKFMQQSEGKPNAIRAMQHLKEIKYNK
jgi:hypothetical protein